jgi:glycosyltransferase involved in cell wall biosynthesis
MNTHANPSNLSKDNSEIPSGMNTESSGFRAAFVTLYDAQDVTKMSGTGFNISQSFLRAGLDLDFIGPLKNQIRPMNVIKHGLNRFFARKNDHSQRDPSFLRHYARQVEEQLQGFDVDVVFGSGGLPVSYIETDLPLVVWTDCTFANLENYYSKYTNLSTRTLRDGHAAEHGLYQRCTRAIFTSSWAAESAINDYGFPREKATIISRGANIPGGRSEADIKSLIDRRPTDKCILHFVGADWDRKGGRIASETARVLNERGIPTELRVVGAEPKVDGPLPGYIKVIGTISKATPQGMSRFIDLLSQAHFLIVPTRAEAYGIVYLEASALGVPSLATRTGGVPSAMVDGTNGVLFDLNDSGDEYADIVERFWHDQEAYKSIAVRAFNDHLNRTNWDVVGSQAIKVLHQAVSSKNNK